MKLKDLEAWRAVVMTGTTQNAAEMLNVSQSAVSRRIAQLEQDLGVTLFTRDRARMTPTRAGASLDRYAQDILERLFLLRHAAEELRDGRSPSITLRLAVPAGITRTILPPIIASFLPSHPDIRFEVLQGTYEIIQEMLAARQAEIGLLRLPVAEPGLDISRTLMSDSVCVIPQGHRLAGKDEIRPYDLRHEPMVLLGWRRSSRRDLDLAFESEGIRPNILIETHSVSSACGLVAQGLGLSIVNSLLVQECMDLPIVIRPFRPSVENRFVLACTPQSNVSKNVAVFADHFLAKLTEISRPRTA